MITRLKVFLMPPFGDFNWMKEIDLTAIDYLGVDIVDELVRKNKAKFSKPGVDFQVMDIVTDPLPKRDVVMCRDCLIHLSLTDGVRAIRNFMTSGAAWLLAT